MDLKQYDYMIVVIHIYKQAVVSNTENLGMYKNLGGVTDEKIYPINL